MVWHAQNLCTADIVINSSFTRLCEGKKMSAWLVSRCRLDPRGSRGATKQQNPSSSRSARVKTFVVMVTTFIRHTYIYPALLDECMYCILTFFCVQFKSNLRTQYRLQSRSSPYVQVLRTWPPNRLQWQERLPFNRDKPWVGPGWTMEMLHYIKFMKNKPLKSDDVQSLWYQIQVWIPKKTVNPKLKYKQMKDPRL